MVTDTDKHQATNFTISIEAAEGITTGISAHDRARTIQVAVAPDAKPEDQEIEDCVGGAAGGANHQCSGGFLGDIEVGPFTDRCKIRGQPNVRVCDPSKSFAEGNLDLAIN